MKIFHVVVFIAVVLVARYLLDQPLHGIFPGETMSSTWIFPYLHMASADLLFFFFVGTIMPIVFRGPSLRSRVVTCCAVFVLIRLLFIAVLGSAHASGWQGYAILSAPFVGTVIGVLAGVAITKLALSAIQENKSRNVESET